MLQGFLIKGWCQAIKTTNVQNPERKAQTLLELMWSEVMESIWIARNKIMHGDKSWYLQKQEKTKTVGAYFMV